ncbi:MAG TPA: threonine--tRNA ligase [Chloroflexota bacterium]|nr:threonine--tRNA ligase [Chloroflexota bacterium]
MTQAVQPAQPVQPAQKQDAVDLRTMRHSAAHVMAQAVQQLFPQARFGIGPAIEDGFYYDFDLPRTLNPEDLAEIERRMQAIVEADLPFQRRELDRDGALRLFREGEQPYKLELIESLTSGEGHGARDEALESPDARGVQGDHVTLYRQGDFEDLCGGPHVERTGQIGPFKLLRVAGAYWRGDQRRPQLQRVYGTAWPSQTELEAYLWRLEEARKRDHRRLGTDLGLFLFSDQVGAGLPIWGEKGAVLRSIIEGFWKEEHLKAGYQYVYSPHIGLIDLWNTSGHTSFYSENMYSPIEVDGQQFLLKPVNCPFHLQVFKRRVRSYRELPLRYNELGMVYRYEPGGTLHGLLRVRGFTQDDSHIFCRPDQLEAEIDGVLELGLKLWRTLGFHEYQIELAVRDPNNLSKYMGTDAEWAQAEAALEAVLQKHHLPYVRAEGEAVFYAPKIDLHLVDALGRKWQCCTIQVDFNMPEGFDLHYIGEDGAQHRPFMVHRALLGSLERFIGVMIEHYAGAFPVWLAPVQAIVLPIADRHNEYAARVQAQLQEAGLRVELDDRSERVNAKIRDAQLQKIPYMLVVGDREAEAGAAAVRLRSGENLGAMALGQVIERITQEDRERSVASEQT